MAIKKYNAPKVKFANEHMRVIGPLVCADGFTMSVQASAGHYCTPRDNTGPYTHFEIGFPSQEEPELMQYAESPDEPTETVYGWVPVEVVTAVIVKHGGLK